MKNGRYTGGRVKKKTGRKLLLAIAALVLVGGLAIAGRRIFFKEHFARNTFIQGVDCSFLTVEEAKEKISEKIEQNPIACIFCETMGFRSSGNLGMYLKDSNEIASILESQQVQNDGERNYTLTSSIVVDDDGLRSFLMMQPELQARNQVKPKDAYIIVQADGTLAIKNEVMGNEIDFEDAFNLAKEALQNGETSIDFSSIANVMPKVLSTDEGLNQNVNFVNQILSTVIEYELCDGSIYTLNKEIMKSWVEVDENGKYFVNTEHVAEFVQTLSEKASEVQTTIMFYPTGKPEAGFPITLNLHVDTQKETERIYQCLEEHGTYNVKPFYKEVDEDLNLLEWLEVDITRQNVWMYIDSECIENTPCRTGNVSKGHDTPTGVFYLWYKQRGATLTDNKTYWSDVDFWMPLLNGHGVGLHDAYWVSQFGGNWYLTHGSHGCINLPYAAAQNIFNNINTSMPIIIYCS